MNNTDPEMKMIQALNITKSFGAHTVLDNVTLEVKKGEVIAIIGPSGSGKSTLLRCFNGLEEIDSGRIIIEGDIFSEKDEKHHKDKITHKAKRDIAKKLGMVFQHFNLFPHMTVLGNVIEAPVTVLGQKKSEVIKNAEMILEKVIARALGRKPDIMLFDEPTSAHDPELIGEVQKVISDLAKEKMTMLIVTHEMRFAGEVADRIIFMDEGKIIEDAKPSEIFNNPEHPRIKTFIDKISRREAD
jgi:polar amino acid transport system ATP-binding protein